MEGDFDLGTCIYAQPELLGSRRTARLHLDRSLCRKTCILDRDKFAQQHDEVDSEQPPVVMDMLPRFP